MDPHLHGRVAHLECGMRTPPCRMGGVDSGSRPTSVAWGRSVASALAGGLPRANTDGTRSLVVLNLGHLNWNLDANSTLGTIRSALKSSLRWAQGWSLRPRSSMVLSPKTNNFSQFMSVSSLHGLITATNSPQNGYFRGLKCQGLTTVLDRAQSRPKKPVPNLP